MTLTATHMALLCRKHGTVTGAQSSRDTGFENLSFLKIQYLFLVPPLGPSSSLTPSSASGVGPGPARPRAIAD